MLKRIVKGLGFATRPGAAVAVVPVASVSAITAGSLGLTYFELVAYGYFSPYLAAAAIISSRMCIRAGLLAATLSFLLWFWAVVPPHFEFGRLPNAAEWSALISVYAAVVLTAPRIEGPSKGGGLTDKPPKIRSALPFVKPRPKEPNGEDRHAYWNVDRPSDWSDGDHLGRQYGRIMVDQVQQAKVSETSHPPLAWVIRDMIRQGQYTGVEAGFAAALERGLRASKPLPMRFGAADLLVEHYDAQDRRCQLLHPLNRQLCLALFKAMNGHFVRADFRGEQLL